MSKCDDPEIEILVLDLDQFLTIPYTTLAGKKSLHDRIELEGTSNLGEIMIFMYVDYFIQN